MSVFYYASANSYLKLFVFENTHGVPIVASAYSYPEAHKKAMQIKKDPTEHLKLVDVITASNKTRKDIHAFGNERKQHQQNPSPEGL